MTMLLSRQLLFLLLLHRIYTAQTTPSESFSGSGDGLVGDYLYNSGSGDAESIYPVVEFLGPEDLDAEERDEEFLHPDFLYSTNNGHRIVEFYAPWCPHCRHLKNHFISFTRTIAKIARSQHQEVKVYAISCTAHKAICQDQNVTSFPKIKVYKAGSINGTQFDGWAFHPFAALSVLEITADNLDEREEDIQQPDQKKLRANVPQKARHTRTKRELYRDITSSFDFAMRNSVYVTKAPLSNETKNAFEGWIELLYQTLPPLLKVHRVVSAIRDNMQDVLLDEQHLLEIMNQYPLEKKGWSVACTHGDKFAGYTCGLWEIFHVMTVGLVEWNGFADDDWIVLSPADAADRLRNYIENFFGCEVCRLNFLAMYDSCGHGRCERLPSSEIPTQHKEWIQLAVWLWETHNSVNVRLMKERAAKEHRETTRQDELDVQWPSRNECPKCWNPDGSWDDELIYKFLRLQYWPDDASSEEYRRELRVKEADEETDDLNVVPSWLPFLPVSFVAIVSLWAFMKKLERDKSGRHKKIDGAP